VARETPDEAQALTKIAKDHLSMVRTFEQRNLIEEGKFTNKDGVFIVFEGFCGIYMCKRKPKQKTDEFGRVINEDQK